ncbi:hypothetical protein ACFOYU_18960 [Microvirga sp. GCM10011540]|uniref:hypothetical protein n=1 Tax=Microvirga sp. GCM10011540 TaxID=3317338 RepID=UPI003605CD14
MKPWFWAGCAVAALAALPSPGRAANSATCHTSASHVVVERPREDFAGMDFLIKAKARPDAEVPCLYRAGKGDFELDVSEDAYFFLGLQGRFLVLDGGTGPTRSLVVYDLDARRKVFEATTSGEDTQVTDKGVTFWMQTGPGTARNCKPYKEYAASGLGAAVETHATFDFASTALRRSSRTRCVATQ